jgi:hypothetical protein
MSAALKPRQQAPPPARSAVWLAWGLWLLVLAVNCDRLAVLGRRPSREPVGLWQHPSGQDDRGTLHRFSRRSGAVSARAGAVPAALLGLLPLLVLLFPTGRLPSRRWRPWSGSLS